MNTTYKLIRSRRRTTCLTITPEAKLIVKAPLLTPKRYIEKFIIEKKNWIEKKIKEIKSNPSPNPKQYENGEDFLYLGKNYKLRIAPTKAPVHLKEELIISTSVWPKHKEALKKWYKSEAEKVIGDRCKIYSKIMNCPPKSIRISHAMKRWGSCTSKGKLNFSWRLIMTPLEIIDYVVVHELAHLDHMNHSKR
ncbi:MAG: SprT family zinc-dependent metalloprotease, partial [Candidatus Gracilibacteria bacterium]|nr:SprT family zinc-dependent metalloprotease [Candidatus Gracilibacteria bacterium]